MEWDGSQGRVPYSDDASVWDGLSPARSCRCTSRVGCKALGIAALLSLEAVLTSKYSTGNDVKAEC